MQRSLLVKISTDKTQQYLVFSNTRLGFHGCILPSGFLLNRPIVQHILLTGVWK